ncbi:MAG: DNA repair protein RecO [Hyphomonadaceae bacterium]|nr:DNA repair protein RecO [Hyphomonadaceae bacterium]
MNWSDEAIVLGGRRFGESGLILDVLTASHGRRSGLVYGGASRKKRAQYEPGNSVTVSWSGRLEDQLGRFDVAEASRERGARLLDTPLALKALAVTTSLLREVLDEGDATGSALYGPSLLLLDSLEDEAVWPALYVRWEYGLLSALGFGLDLEACALSGANDGLTHVSPRTGRAVRGSEAEEYLDRLLPLPGFLLDAASPTGPRELAHGLDLTGHFLAARLFASVHKDLPDGRARLVAQMQRAGVIAL